MVHVLCPQAAVDRAVCLHQLSLAVPEVLLPVSIVARVVCVHHGARTLPLRGRDRGVSHVTIIGSQFGNHMIVVRSRLDKFKTVIEKIDVSHDSHKINA